MKGLRKVLTPFAPDQSGASGVLYQMGGLIVIIDAGGCTGNVCGFDEPRWHESRSAVFSAGLRDMDAILGRDELLASKIRSASERIDTSFVAVIGTPVPATIGTDYKALKKLIESKVDIPVLPVITNGMKLYNEGEKQAYKALIDEFASDIPAYRDRIVIGMTPLTYGKYHEDLTLDDIRNIRGAGELIAASSSGIDACEYLGKDFKIESPIYKDNIPEGRAGQFQGVRIIGQVFVPGLIGPAIGAWVLRNADVIVNNDGTESFLPDRGIWSASAVIIIILFAALMLTMRKKNNGSD